MTKRKAKKILRNLLILVAFQSSMGIISAKAEDTNNSENDFSNMSLEDLLNTNISVSSSEGDKIFTTPSSVSVIDKAMIRQYNLQTISEAVDLIAGINLGRTYIMKDIPNSRGIIQDHYANKVLILINNIPSWSPVTGEGANVNRININDVERIEVLKGPASVLYGTNAYSGAINIILKESKEGASSGVNMGFGDKGVLKAGGNFIYSKDDFNLFVSANSGDEKGHDLSSVSETANETILMREYEKASNFTLFSKFKSNSLFFNAYTLNYAFFGASAPTLAGGAGKNQALSGYLLNYMFDPTFFGWWNIKFNATYDWNDRNMSRSKDDLTRSNIDGYRLAASLKTNMSLLDAFKITPGMALNDLNLELGVDYDYRKSNEYKNYTVVDNKVVADNNMKEKNISEYSVFGQGKYSVGPFKLIGTELPLTLLLGTRYTQNELFGNNFSSRGTLVYPFSDKNSLKFIFGQSYRTPSLFELYFETPEKTVFGNKSLKPETSNSYELSYLTSFDKFFIQALVYHADYQNAISRTKRLPNDAKDTSTMYTNNLPFSANGLELEVKYQNPEILNAFVNYSFIRGINPEKITAFDFKYVPEHTVALGLSKKIYDFSASSVLNLYSQTIGPVGTNGTVIPMQYTIDLNLGYDQVLFGKNIRHNFSVKDILDGRMLQPEFVRKKINEIPLGVGRRFSYSLMVDF